MSSRIAANVKRSKQVEDALKENKGKRDASLDRNNIKTNVVAKSKTVPTKTFTTESKSNLISFKSKPSTSKVTPRTVKKDFDGSSSSRIQTTQYYPNKQQIIKNVLKSEGITVNKQLSTKPLSKSSTKIIKTNTIDAKNAKVRNVPKDSNNSPDTSNSLISDRPGTATLSKGLIVNANIAGPDVPILLTTLQNHVEHKHNENDPNPITENNNLRASDSKTSDEDNYEDDFDSYASDFDEYHSSSSIDVANLTADGAITSCSSTEELDAPAEATKRVSSAEDEKKMDSGNFDLPEYKHKHLLDNIHEDNEANLSLMVQANALSSLSDEGFEDGKVVRTNSSHFIDFSKVKMQIEKRRSIERGKTRGEEILEMIKLDAQSFVVLDMSPISYEAFIKSFGNRRSCQVSCQTGEDDLSDETQTDSINTCDKWTQCPIKLTRVANDNINYLQVYKSDLLGVGTNNINDQQFKATYSEITLAVFLKNASKLILTLLEEAGKSTAKNIEVNTDFVPFSSGFISLNTRYKEFLKGRIVTKIIFSNKTNSKLLSVHRQMNNSIPNNKSTEFTCLLCVWDINKADKPEYILSCFGDINCCCFHIENSSIILAGLTDGTITIWDTNNNNISQKGFDYTDEFSIVLPSYTSDINSDINTPVIFVQTSYHIIDITSSTYEKSSIQVYTINEDSTLRTWGIIKLLENNSNFYYTLVLNYRVYLGDIYPELNDIQCLTATMSNLDPNHLFISTNYGNIIHCLTTKTKANPKKFARIADEISLVTSISSCPYAPFHFLAATNVGSTVMYSRTLSRPLMTFKHHDNVSFSANDAGEMKGKSQVLWSFTRPCRFYTISPDGRVLHCWNLAYSDMVPENSVNFDWIINDIALSPFGTNKINGQNLPRCYMAISTEDDIFLHVLNEHHGIQSLINYHNDIKLFMNYVNRL